MQSVHVATIWREGVPASIVTGDGQWSEQHTGHDYANGRLSIVRSKVFAQEWQVGGGEQYGQCDRERVWC